MLQPTVTQPNQLTRTGTRLPRSLQTCIACSLSSTNEMLAFPVADLPPWKIPFPFSTGGGWESVGSHWIRRDGPIFCLPSLLFSFLCMQLSICKFPVEAHAVDNTSRSSQTPAPVQRKPHRGYFLDTRAHCISLFPRISITVNDPGVLHGRIASFRLMMKIVHKFPGIRGQLFSVSPPLYQESYSCVSV